MISKKHLLVFYLVTICFWGALYVNTSIIPSYAESLGSTATFVGVIAGSYGFMQLLLRLPLGILSDKIGKRKIFINAAFITSMLAGIAMYYTDAPVGLLIGRAFCGISACAYVQIITLFTGYFSAQETPKAIGNMSFIVNLSQLCGLLIAAFIAGLYGVKSTFIATIVFAVIGFTLSLFIFERKIVRTPLKMVDLKKVFSSKYLIAAIIIAIICQFLAFGKSWSFVPLAASRLGASSTVQTLLTATYSFMAAAAAIISGRLAIKHGFKMFIIIGLITHAVGSFIIPVFPYISGLFISQIFSGIGNGMTMTLLMSMGLIGISQEKRGSAMGLYQALYGIGMVAGPVVVGALTDIISLNVGFIATGLLAIVGSFIGAFSIRNTAQKA